MIGILIGVGGTLAAIAYWVVGASYIYCRLSRHMDQFVFPYDQWFDALAFWNANLWTKLFIIVSAALPIVLAAAIGRIIYFRYRPGANPLYGKTGWATGADMHSGGIE
ncbi:MAG: hypothetical protein ACJ8AI_24980, partial [Rhodopila sp.]